MLYACYAGDTGGQCRVRITLKRGALMTIHCDSLMDFMYVIQGLVERGLTFKAYTNNLTIECTGGY